MQPEYSVSMFVDLELQLVEFESAVAVIAQFPAAGATEAGLEVELQRNAVVQVFDVLVQAARASSTFAGKVAQVRLSPGQGELAGKGVSAVLDFGTPRTVQGVMAPAGCGVVRIFPWMGTAFSQEPVYQRELAQAKLSAMLASEIRTERLLVEMTGSPDAATLGETLRVLIPESPSGLEIRIDGGAPVWTHSGPAQPGLEADLSDFYWNKEGKRIVHLADALAKLTGDPHRPEQATFKLVLTARVPGVLALTRHAVSAGYVHRVKFDGDTAKSIAFAAEGTADLPLQLPAPGTIREVRLTALGNLPRGRVLPSLGPEPSGDAELALDPDHAACVRIPADTGLAELTGLRLPLLAGASGAEARVVLWMNRTDAEDPAEAIREAASDPVVLQPTEAEAWTSFVFPQPVPLAGENPPWAAIQVTRGEAVWALGGRGAGGAATVRTGPPAGPWKKLPQVLEAGLAGLQPAGGRLRVMGTAPGEKPLAPLRIALAGAPEAVEVTPSVKGVTVVLALDAASGPAPALRVLSRTAGEVVLRDIDVIVTA